MNVPGAMHVRVYVPVIVSRWLRMNRGLNILRLMKINVFDADCAVRSAI